MFYQQLEPTPAEDVLEYILRTVTEEDLSDAVKLNRVEQASRVYFLDKMSEGTHGFHDPAA